MTESVGILSKVLSLALLYEVPMCDMMQFLSEYVFVLTSQIATVLVANFSTNSVKSVI